MRAPVPISMWAAICRNPRAEWVMGHAIRHTRSEARAAYLDTWLPEYQKKALTHVRFARVVVAQKDPPCPSAHSVRTGTLEHVGRGQIDSEPS